MSSSESTPSSASRPVREKLTSTVLEAVQATRGMGRVMLSAAAGGATHERIGVVDAVAAEAGALRLSGAAHDALLDLSVVSTVVADRSGRMRDRVLPRLELQDAAGTTLFSLIALDGLEPFDLALGSLPAGEELPAKERPAPGAPGAPAEVDAADPGAAPLHAAQASGRPIRIAFSAPGLEQSWEGVVAEVKPAMGFINIIQPDFHLHLKAGAVAAWAREDRDGTVVLDAEGHDGQRLGLRLSGPAAAF